MVKTSSKTGNDASAKTVKNPENRQKSRSDDKKAVEPVEKLQKSRSATPAKSPKRRKNSEKTKKPHFRRIRRQIQKIRIFRAHRLRLHKSFRRSYREDYTRETSTPGLLSHAMTTFQLLGKHWKTFLPFIGIMVLLFILLVGLMSESFYQEFQTTIDDSSEAFATGRLGNFARAGLLLLTTVTSGGLDASLDEVSIVFAVTLFLVIWLVTIFLIRHYVAGSFPKLRDGLYNALSPLLSTLVVFCIMFVQAIPIMLVIITYSAALSTDFLATPFYALLYFIFAALMLLLSGYLLSSSIIALVAVTAPGTYPIAALATASDLMAGRRIRFIIRLLYLIVVVAFIYIITMLPIILLDLWLKSFWDFIAGWPIVPFFLLAVTCFVFIYATAYIYRYYRFLLDYKEK